MSTCFSLWGLHRVVLCACGGLGLRVLVWVGMFSVGSAWGYNGYLKLYNTGTNAFYAYNYYYTSADCSGGGGSGSDWVQPGSYKQFNRDGATYHSGKWEVNSILLSCKAIVESQTTEWWFNGDTGVEGDGATYYTNYWACLWVTNTQFAMSQNFQFFLVPNGGNPTNPFPIWLALPREYREFCVTNSQPFSFYAAGDLEDYYSTTGTASTGTNQVPNGTGSGPTSQPTNQPPVLQPPPSMSNSPPATVGGQKAQMDQTAEIGRTAHTDATNIVTQIVNMKNTIVSNGITVIGLTNVATETTQRGTTNLLGQVVGSLTNLDAFVRTNGYGASSNIAYSGSMSASNSWYGQGSTNWVQLSDWEFPTASEGDRSVWGLRFRLCSDGGGTGGGYENWSGTMNLNPTTGPVADFYGWIRTIFEWLLCIGTWLVCVWAGRDAISEFQGTPGSGRGAAANTPWAGGLWVQGIAGYVYLLGALLVGIMYFISAGLVSIGGFFAHPFTSAGVAAAGDFSGHIRAAGEVVDAIFPLTLLGLCCVAILTFRFLIDGMLWTFQAIYKAHI